MRTILAMMPKPCRQKETIARLQHLIENRWPLGGCCCDARDRVGARRVEDLPSFRAGDLKDDQIFGIEMAFGRAATTTRDNRCSADLLQRVSRNVLAECSESGHMFMQLIEN